MNAEQSPTRMLELAPLQPLAIGNLRAIYQHPHHSDLLVKVLRPEAIARRWGAHNAFKRRSRTRQYGSFVRELKEYIALRAQIADVHPPVARIVGVVETDMGLGLLSEKIGGADGHMAPSLRAICFAGGGMPEWLDDALNKLLEEVLRFNMILGDLHSGNIVHGSDSRGGPRLLFIDGFGEKNLVPLSSMSRTRNRWNTQRLFRRLRKELSRPLAEWGPAVRPD